MNHPAAGSIPVMKTSVPVSTPARASAAQASGPWMARNTRSSAAIWQSKPAASALQMRFVDRGVAGVGHDHEAIGGKPGDDEVVDDAGLLVEEERIFRLRQRQPGGVQRAGPGDQPGGTWSRQLEQPHMRNVEQAGMLACMQMLLHDAGRIGDRHGPAGKWPETGAGGDMKVFEGEAFQAGVGHCFSRAHVSSRFRSHPCPSV